MHYYGIITLCCGMLYNRSKIRIQYLNRHYLVTNDPVEYYLRIARSHYHPKNRLVSKLSKTVPYTFVILSYTHTE